MTQNDTKPDDIHNRVVRIPLRYEEIQPLFTGEIAIATRLPEDAKLINIFEEDERRQYNFVFRHESFDPISEGDLIPAIVPEYQHLGGDGDDLLEGAGLY